jgi:putative flavoprotein involved in K+ transport
MSFDLLEQADGVGAAWRTRYDSLRLHTSRAWSGLPGARIPRRFGQWVRRDDLVRYFEQYVRRFDLAPHLGVAVHRIDRVEHRWVVQTSTGPIEADAVVIATGLSRSPLIPSWPGLETFTGDCCHSSEYRVPTPYRGRDVLVVGAGNSAAEIATELTGFAARVQLSIRTPPNIVRRDLLGLPSQAFGIILRRCPERVLNLVTGAMRRLTVPDLDSYGLPAPSGDGFTQYLRSEVVPVLDHGFVAAVRAGDIAVVPEIAEIVGPEVRLTDGRTLRPDAIVAATGFRPALESLVGHLGVLDQRGRPRADGLRTPSEAPDLFFVGLHVVLSGVLREVGQEARAVGRILADERDRSVDQAGADSLR